MDSEKQIKISRFYGMVVMIARKTGYNKDFVSRVLSGKVTANTKSGRIILTMAEKISENIESVSLDDE